MHVALSRNETNQNFNIWVYGERDQLVRGSGLFVGETGVSAIHHFLAPRDGSSFGFTEGHYRSALNSSPLAVGRPCWIARRLARGDIAHRPPGA